MLNLSGMKWLHPDQFCWCVEQGFCISMENRERLKTMHPPSSKTLYCGTQNQAINLAINLFFSLYIGFSLHKSTLDTLSLLCPTNPTSPIEFWTKERKWRPGNFHFFPWLISCLHVTQLTPKERWKSYINVKWEYSAAGHLEIKSVITNTEVDCKFPAGIHPHLHSTATIKWWQWWSESNI